MDKLLVNTEAILADLGIEIKTSLVKLAINTCIAQIINRLNKNITKDEVVNLYEDVIIELVLNKIINLNTTINANGAASITEGSRSITFKDVSSISFNTEVNALVPTYVRCF